MAVNPRALVRVSDLLNRKILAINDGYRVTNKELGATGVPFVRGGDIGDGEINTKVADHVLPQYLDRITAKLTRVDDVAFITKGSVGRVGIIRSGQSPVVFAPQVSFWRVLDRTVLDARFLFYVLRSREFQAQLDAVKTHGSMVADYVSLSDQAGFWIPVPPMGHQRAVAEILGTLDDKIELNRRMNQSLEAMAQTLFRSWFADFDPVRAHAEGRQPEGIDAETAVLFPSKLTDSALGKIPEGWKRCALGDVIEIFDSERVPLSSRERELRRGPYPYYGAASVMDSVDAYLFDGTYVLMGEDGSVVDSSDRPVLQYVWGKFWVNNHAHVLRARFPISPEHLLLSLRETNIRAFVTGAVQPKLNQANMKRIPFLLATPGICTRFAQIIEPLFAKLRANTDENKTLANLRDTLLPKLLSGELRLQEAEAQLAASG